MLLNSDKLPDHRNRLVVDRRGDRARLLFDVLHRALDLGLRVLVPAPVGPGLLQGWNFAAPHRGRRARADKNRNSTLRYHCVSIRPFPGTLRAPFLSTAHHPNTAHGSAIAVKNVVTIPAVAKPP